MKWPCAVSPFQEWENFFQSPSGTFPCCLIGQDCCTCLLPKTNHLARDIGLTRLEKDYVFPEGRGCLDSEQHLGSISKEEGPVALLTIQQTAESVGQNTVSLRVIILPFSQSCHPQESPWFVYTIYCPWFQLWVPFGNGRPPENGLRIQHRESKPLSSKDVLQISIYRYQPRILLSSCTGSFPSTERLIREPSSVFQGSSPISVWFQ